MFKIPNKYSIIILLVLAVMFFAICIAGAVVMPTLCEMLIDTKDHIGNRGEITSAGRAYVLFLAYLLLAVVMFADILLCILLLRVRKGLVFTSQSTELVRGIAWSCFLLGAVFLGLGVYFTLAFIPAFAGGVPWHMSARGKKRFGGGNRDQIGK